jgi:MFS family permease
MQEVQEPNKPYYGWYITATLAVTETISWGILYYAFSVFVTPMEADLGWSRTELTGGFSLALLVTGLMAFPVGWWVDRYGARLLMTAASIAATLLVLAWSQVTTLTSFYLVCAGIGVCSAALLYETAFAVIATWFVRRRSTALAVVTFAGGLASTIFLPLSDALLEAFAWRKAILILGIFLGVTTTPLHALILRRRPADLGYLPDGKLSRSIEPIPVTLSGISLSNALHSRFFWLMTLAFSLSYLSAAAIRVHFIPLLIEANVDASTAAFASGSIGLMQVLGRLLCAPLDTRFSGRVLIGGVFVLQAVAAILLILDTSLWMISGFIVVFGTAYGARTLIRPAILANAFGASHYGRISSVMAIFLTLAATIAPVGAGWLHDFYGNYELVLWLVVILAGAAAGVMIFTAHHSANEMPSLSTSQPSAGD